MIKPISISLSPNTLADDTRLAARTLLSPWFWNDTDAVSEFEEAFKSKFGLSNATSFNSGRSALLALLESFDLNEGDEVLIQAFTCNAVPNPVMWAGLVPVYVDCNIDDYNISIEDLKLKLTDRSKVIIVQHTFGIPANMKELLDFCKKNNLLLIEDCAHALGAKYDGQYVGTLGDAAIFSFSRDKVISCVYGGMATAKDDGLAARIAEYRDEKGNPSFIWIARQLMHPMFMNWLVLPTYKFFGKPLLVILQATKILSKAVHWKEKIGERPGYFPKALPGALATLALHQFKKLDEFNEHRRVLASRYSKQLDGTDFTVPADAFREGGIFLRLPVRHPSAHDIIKKAWKEGVLLGDWYTTPVSPHDTDLDSVGYEYGSCPNAEVLCSTTLNLPTHINMTRKHEGIVMRCINKYAGKI